MSDKVFIDTSFIIALVNINDQFHEQAELLSYKIENSSLLTTNAVLLEIGNGLAKSFKDDAIKIINIILGSRNIDVLFIDNGLFKRGFEMYTDYHDKNWGLVDCISFVVMKENGIKEVLTFDDDFEQAGYLALKV
jgi:uncharacterized protein